jgi:hypothetical protein
MQNDKGFGWLMIGCLLLFVGISLFTTIINGIGYYQLILVKDTNDALSVLGLPQLQQIYNIQVLKFLVDYGVSFKHIVMALLQPLSAWFWLMMGGLGCGVVTIDEDYRAKWLVINLLPIIIYWVVYQVSFLLIVLLMLNAKTSLVIIQLIHLLGWWMMVLSVVALIVHLRVLWQSYRSWRGIKVHH